MITSAQLVRGMDRYAAGDRPWPERAKAVDWFVVSDEGELYPLKYTYGLATNTRPALLTTNQMKRELQPLGVAFVSIRTHYSTEAEFERAVDASLKDAAGRAKRLALAPRMPKQRVLVQRVFLRSADVVAAVLDRARGRCEVCREPAPFTTRKANRPYLEVHHRKTLATGGEDTVENAIATCPNCHREAHYG